MKKQSIVSLMMLISIIFNSIAFADVVDFGMGRHDILGMAIGNNTLLLIVGIFTLIIVSVIITLLLLKLKVKWQKIVFSILAVIIGLVFLFVCMEIIGSTSYFDHGMRIYLDK